MKKKTFNNRVGRVINDIYLVPYRSRSGNFAGTKQIGTDDNGQPIYKYLRLKRFSSLGEFFSYYGIVPLNRWKEFTRDGRGKSACQSLRAAINGFSSAAMSYYSASEASSASSRAKDDEIDSLHSEVASLRADKENSVNHIPNSETSSVSENQPNPNEQSRSSVSPSASGDTTVAQSTNADVTSESSDQISQSSDENNGPAESSDKPSSSSDVDEDAGLDLDSLVKSSESVSIEESKEAKAAQPISSDGDDSRPDNDQSSTDGGDEQSSSSFDFAKAEKKAIERNPSESPINNDGSINNGAWNNQDNQ